MDFKSDLVTLAFVQWRTGLVPILTRTGVATHLVGTTGGLIITLVFSSCTLIYIWKTKAQSELNWILTLFDLRGNYIISAPLSMTMKTDQSQHTQIVQHWDQSEHETKTFNRCQGRENIRVLPSRDSFSFSPDWSTKRQHLYVLFEL